MSLVQYSYFQKSSCFFFGLDTEGFPNFLVFNCKLQCDFFFENERGAWRHLESKCLHMYLRGYNRQEYICRCPNWEYSYLYLGTVWYVAILTVKFCILVPSKPFVEMVILVSNVNWLHYLLSISTFVIYTIHVSIRLFLLFGIEVVAGTTKLLQIW